LTEARKGAVVHACDECAANEGWDLACPLEELETATRRRLMVEVDSPDSPSEIRTTFSAPVLYRGMHPHQGHEEALTHIAVTHALARLTATGQKVRDPIIGLHQYLQPFSLMRLGRCLKFGSDREDYHA
jgi:hypothetical protein